MAMEWLAKQYRDDIDMCNLIGTKRCNTCGNNRVPNVAERETCMQCIKDDAIRELQE